MTAQATYAVVLDLDDTLYLERDYVRSGFNAVGRHLAGQGVMEDFSERAWALFESGLRNTIFDAALASSASISITELVEIYRAHQPDIALCPDAIRFLERFPANRPLGMVTDGPITSQAAKVRALGLEQRISPIVMSDSFGVTFRKPHDRPFETIERALGVAPERIVYIGDNPLKDFVTPRRRGWRTIRIRRPLGEHTARLMVGEYAAHTTVTTLDALDI
ncbi:MAG: HAD family hydrolase [Candidatus Sphingomonas colombiensis]|nr:HAD family hydrolase [Sphingomonas sp.]WEK44389.1 MAG: HAD family hydrolase [Sphingomonas sp.]